MDKIARRIFQPDLANNKILEEFSQIKGISLNEFINYAIRNTAIPNYAPFRKDAQHIIELLDNNEDPLEGELKTILARSVETLKEHPIKDSFPLEKIFYYFTNPVSGHYRFDYIDRVHIDQDKTLRHLNEILYSLDSDFNLGMREFGERSRTIFRHWDRLCVFPEIYHSLSVLIECEDTYRELDECHVLYLLMLLDDSVINSTLVPSSRPYEVNISLKKRYEAKLFEIGMYYTDNAYYTLSGGPAYNSMHEEILAFYNKYINFERPLGDVTEEDIARVDALEQEGKMLFRKLPRR